MHNSLLVSTFMLAEMSPSHQYYVCLKNVRQPIHWDPSKPNDSINIDCSLQYFGKVLEAMAKSLITEPLIFYITWENLDWLPSYGNNVVVILLGDELHRIPNYFDKVRAVFKCFGISPYLRCNPFIQPSHLNLAIVLQFIRNWIVCLPGWLNYKLKMWVISIATGKTISNIYNIPIGYYKQLDLPIKNINERYDDVFFAGSINNQIYPFWSLKYWFQSPKSIARRNMLSNISKIEQKNLGVKFNIKTIADFNEARSANERSYSEQLMNAKICLVPRGTTSETYRFLEGLRYGCILITEPLPLRWFYDGSPAIEINDWEEIETVLEMLLKNEQMMQRKHQEALFWWKNKCSEVAVGNYIAETLNSLVNHKNI
jgi:hypothetical protein